MKESGRHYNSKNRCICRSEILKFICKRKQTGFSTGFSMGVGGINWTSISQEEIYMFMRTILHYYQPLTTEKFPK